MTSAEETIHFVILISSLTHAIKKNVISCVEGKYLAPEYIKTTLKNKYNDLLKIIFLMGKVSLQKVNIS